MSKLLHSYEKDRSVPPFPIHLSPVVLDITVIIYILGMLRAKLSKDHHALEHWI